MDPQLRMLLEVSYEAIVDAGIKVSNMLLLSTFVPSKAGVPKLFVYSTLWTLHRFSCTLKIWSHVLLLSSTCSDEQFTFYSYAMHCNPSKNFIIGSLSLFIIIYLSQTRGTTQALSNNTRTQKWLVISHYRICDSTQLTLEARSKNTFTAPQL